jgi:glycosyltransferase involved in cell wall biosynthesis
MVDGIVVTYKECGSLADGILQVLDSPEVASRMGRAARERIQELSMQWSTSSVAESWETLIAALSENTFVKRVWP